MKKALEFAETLSIEYTHLLEGKTFQKVFKEHDNESYHSSYAGGTVKLQATGASASVFAVRELMIGKKSGHTAEYLGDFQPRFSLRPLWMSCDCEVDVNGVKIYLPHYLVEDPHKVHLMCCRLLELGYNALVFGGSGKKSGSTDLEHLFQEIRQYGIKIILKCEDIPGHLPFDYLLKESKDFENKSKNTQLEKIVREVKKIESLGSPLIFYLDARTESEAQRQSRWMSELCDEMGVESLLAFPSVVEGKLHPFWEVLRVSPDVSSTPLLPVVNMGNVGCGDGLWPSLNLRLLNKVFGHMQRHVFAGVIGVINQLPKREGLLDCTLWAAAQFLWKRQRIEQAVETWFLAHHPEMEYSKYFEVIDDLVHEIHALKRMGERTSEESKVIAESLIARLKEIQVKLEVEERKRLKKTGISLHDYFVYFERDARRLILQFLQKHHVALASLLNNDDAGEGFWTSGGKGGKVTVLEEPSKGTGMMTRIYSDNRLF